jgi:hypothetical protein
MGAYGSSLVVMLGSPAGNETPWRVGKFYILGLFFSLGPRKSTKNQVFIAYLTFFHIKINIINT